MDRMMEVSIHVWVDGLRNRRWLNAVVKLHTLNFCLTTAVFWQVCLYDEELKPLACEDSENKWWHVAVTSQGKTWVLRRSYENFRMLDKQLHRCIYDRKFSGLQELPPEDNVPGNKQEVSEVMYGNGFLIFSNEVSMESSTWEAFCALMSG